MAAAGAIRALRHEALRVRSLQEHYRLSREKKNRDAMNRDAN